MLPRTPRPIAALLAALLLLPEPSSAAALGAFRAQVPGRLSKAPGFPGGTLLHDDGRVPRLGPSFHLSSPRAAEGLAAPFSPLGPQAVAPSALGLLRADSFGLSARVDTAPGESLSSEASGLFEGVRVTSLRSVDGTPGREGAGFALARPSNASAQRRAPRGLKNRDVSAPLKRLGLLAAKLTGLRALWGVYRDGVLVQRYAARLADLALPAAERASAARRLTAFARRETIQALGYASAHDPDPRVRRAALVALVHLGKEWLPRLTRELKLHPSVGRRLNAARDLAWLARSSVEPLVVQALVDAAALDSSEDVRLTAIEGLATARHAKAFSRLEWLFQRETVPHVRSVLALALGGFAEKRLASFGQTVSYRPPAGEFESTKQPLYAAALKKVIAVGVVFVAVELIGGFVTGSIALRADATHMLADLAISAGSLLAVWMARRPPTSRRTYGFLKSEAVMGLLSAVAIGFMGGEMLTEAIPRLWAPVPFEGLTTVFLALAGLASNAISTLILYRYRDDNLSLKGAFLHSLTDAIGSVGIIAAGLLSMAFGWAIADPIITLGIVALIGRTTWGLLKRSLSVLIDAVPPGVDLDAVEAGLLKVPGVVAVHDLHVWSLNSTQTVATATLYVKPGTDHEAALAASRALLRETHGIGHATVQVEVLKSAR